METAEPGPSADGWSSTRPWCSCIARPENEKKAKHAGQASVCWATVPSKEQMVGNTQIQIQFLSFSFSGKKKIKMFGTFLWHFGFQGKNVDLPVPSFKQRGCPERILLQTVIRKRKNKTGRWNRKISVCIASNSPCITRKALGQPKDAWKP